MYFKSVCPSPLGEITLVCDETDLLHLSLPGQRPFPHPAVWDCRPNLEQTKNWLDRYIAGQAPSPDELPLRPEGTPFRRLVWKLLLEIPYGETVTYGDLAKKAACRLGKAAMSAQAVGQAVGRNPIAIIIPCHRCIGADGSLTGYAGGIHYKKALLQLEAP